MFEKIRNKYLYNKTQIVILNKQGIVLDSDDLLFPIAKQTSITDFHPFFETVLSLIDLELKNFTFNCIHIASFDTKKSIDVIFNSGSTTENPFLIFIDFTDHYENFQSIAQEKNESVLSFHLSELKNQQLQIEKNFKDKFLANVSHDLKTPIWGLNFFLNYLNNTSLDATQKEYVTTLLDSTNHIYRLVEDLLDLSKIESGQITIKETLFDFTKMLHHLNAILQPKIEEKKLAFHFKNETSIQNIIGDEARLKQILINLVDNAIKFTKKGSISFSVKLVETATTLPQLEFSITDTGSGIVAQQKNDVYKSFTKLHKQKKVEGLGLGLSIVSNLVSLMNGTIDYTTKVGKGTVFKVVIPVKVA